MPMKVRPSCPQAHDVQADLDHIATFLRQERERQGLGLEGLAARAGTSKTHIAHFETGERDMTLRRFLQLLHALGASITDVFPPEGPSVLAQIVLHIHARGATFAERQLALLEVLPDCLSRRHD